MSERVGRGGSELVGLNAEREGVAVEVAGFVGTAVGVGQPEEYEAGHEPGRPPPRQGHAEDAGQGQGGGQHDRGEPLRHPVPVRVDQGRDGQQGQGHGEDPLRAPVTSRPCAV